MASSASPGEEQALLIAITADPDADAPRLRYARLLEDRGEPRGEFIRLQCELDEGAAGDRAPEIEARVAHLLAAHESEWLAPLGKFVRAHSFRRGFIESLLLSGYPCDMPGLAKLVAEPVLCGLTSLGLDSMCGPSGAAALAASPLLGRLVYLSLARNEIGDEGALDLAASPYLSRLLQLDLSVNLIADAGAVAIASATGLRNLVRLDLAGNQVGGTGLAAIVTSPYLPALRSLTTSYGRPPFLEWAPREDRCAGSAVFWAAQTGLACINCSGAPVGDAAIAQIAVSPRLSTVSTLDLYGAGIEAGGAHALGASPFLSNLQLLDLGAGQRYGRNKIGDAGMTALAPSQALTSLQHLVLTYNEIGATGAAALAAAPLSTLQTLDLGYNQLGDKGVTALAGSPVRPGLAYLDLSFNQVGDPGAAGLAVAPMLATVTALDLGGNNIGPAGAADMARSPHLGALRSLRLGRSVDYKDESNNRIGDKGAAAIAGASWLSNVRTLDLSANGIGDAGVEALAASPHLQNIIDLDLSNNDLSDAALDALVRSPHLGALRRLGLSNSLPDLTYERSYDWDGSVAYVSFNSDLARTIGQRFPREVTVY